MTDGKRFDRDLMRSNSVYAARVAKHLDARYYESSPAKDTVECQRIRELLAQEGLGTDAIADAYNAAWDYAQGDPDGVVSKMMRDTAITKLRNKYGITNSVFFKLLFDIKPELFFGDRSYSLVEGETLSE